MSLHAVDLMVIVLSVLGSLWIGHRARKGRADDQRPVEYILAGRSLTAPLFAASLIATWYGAVLGAGEFVARHGVVMILCFGLPYYAVAAVYAYTLSRRIRLSEAISIPDQMRRVYGERVGMLAAGLLLMIAIPAPYMLTLGMILRDVTSLPLPLAIVLGSVTSLAIVTRGGLRSDVYANVLQVIVMYAGFAALVVASISVLGSPSMMWAALPAQHRQLTGDLGWSGVLVWLLIALQTLIDPNFHVRAAAARSPDVAQRGLWWSIAGWMVFDGLQLMAGLYAVAFMDIGDPSQTFLTLAAQVLPPGLLGLFVASLLAAVISTLDGYALVSATTIGHDLLGRWRRDGSQTTLLVIGVVMTGVTGTIAAIAIPSIVDLLVYAASMAVPALLMPLMWSYRKSIKPFAASSRRVEIWMALPAMIAACTLLAQYHGLTTLEPMLTGMMASVLLTPYATRTPSSAS